MIGNVGESGASKRTVAVLSLSLFYAANALFVIKYGARRFPLGAALVVATAYWVICMGALLLLPRMSKALTSKFLFWGAVASVSGMAALLYHAIPQHLVRNDRYFMVQIFWTNFFHHCNPYHPAFGAFSANVPGAFPFYFLLTLPAFLAGEIGLITLAGAGIFVYCLVRIFKDRPAQASFGLAIMLLSIAFWYEIPTRSTLFFNMSIVLWYSVWFTKGREWTTFKVLAAGVLGGIALSTRSVVVLPIAACYLFSLKNASITVSKALVVVFVNMLVFIAPIVLLWLWHPADFMLYNPFQVQSDYGTLLVIPVMLVSAWGISRAASSFEGLIFLNGLLILCIIFMQYASRILASGWGRCLFDNGMDISYLVMALPFLAIGSPALFHENLTLIGERNP